MGAVSGFSDFARGLRGRFSRFAGTLSVCGFPFGVVACGEGAVCGGAAGSVFSEISVFSGAGCAD